MKKNILLGLFLGLVIFGIKHFMTKNTYPEDIPAAVKSKPLGGDFAINSSHGQDMLSHYAGKVVILYFGYTFCPDVCPTTLSTISKALRSLDAKDQDQVKVMFISLDPKRDSFERLDEYVKFFHPNISAYTDSEENLQKITKQYGVYFKANAPEKGKDYYTIDHTTQAFLVNKNGELVEFIQHGTATAEFVEIIKKYL